MSTRIFTLRIVIAIVPTITAQRVTIFSQTFRSNTTRFTVSGANIVTDAQCPSNNRCLAINKGSEIYTYTSTEQYHSIYLEWSMQTSLAGSTGCDVYYIVNKTNNITWDGWINLGSFKVNKVTHYTIDLPAADDNTIVGIDFSGENLGKNEDTCFINDVELTAILITSPPTTFPTINPTTFPTIIPTKYPTKLTLDTTNEETSNPTVISSTIASQQTITSMIPTTDPTMNPTVDSVYDPTNDVVLELTMNPTMSSTIISTMDESLEDTKANFSSDVIGLSVIIYSGITVVALLCCVLLCCWLWNRYMKKQQHVQTKMETYITPKEVKEMHMQSHDVRSVCSESVSEEKRGHEKRIQSIHDMVCALDDHVEEKKQDQDVMRMPTLAEILPLPDSKSSYLPGNREEEKTGNGEGVIKVNDDSGRVGDDIGIKVKYKDKHYTE